MEHPNSNGGIDWRQYAKKKLWELELGVIDPTDSPLLDSENLETPEKRQQVLEWKKSGEYDKVKQHYKTICLADIRLVELSNFLICYLDITQYPCGTYDETFFAASQKKPVLIVCPHRKSEVPNWLWGRLKHELFFQSIDECIEYLKRVDEGLEPTLNRWVFFNYDKLYGTK